MARERTSTVRRRVVIACCTTAVGVGALLPAAASAALPAVAVDATTAQLTHGSHRGVTVTAGCDTGTLVGGGGYLRNASDPTTIPTNGLVLGGVAPSTGATPVDQGVADGTTDPGSWLTIANFTGASELGDQATSFALCATGGPTATVVRTAETIGANAAQQTAAPTRMTATCAPGTRLIGGAAMTRTPDQVSDGVTVGGSGNLKPLGNYPSDAAGNPALDGSRDATSWTAYGSAGITTPNDKVIAYALCATGTGADVPVEVARTDVDGPDAQTGSTPLWASATCPAGTRMLGGGYAVDQTVGAVGGLQPQQGYHMRGSFPAADTGGRTEVALGATDPATWTALVQAGGQNLAVGSHMTIRGFAMCAGEPAPPEAAALSLDLEATPTPAVVGEPLTYALTVDNDGPATATVVVATTTLPANATYVSADATVGTCDHAAGTVTCELGELEDGAQASATIVVLPTSTTALEANAVVDATTPGAGATKSLTTPVNAAERAATHLTVTTADATLGGALGAQVTLSGGNAPTGTVVFTLHGPGDDACASPLATSNAVVDGNGTYAAAPHLVTTAGRYRWVARYDGDAANAPAGPSACGNAAATAAVKAAPALTVVAEGGTTVGSALSGVATLDGAVLASGSIAFDLYGPGDDACAVPLASTSVPVFGNGAYRSPSHVTTVPGTYRWVARYDGNDLTRPTGTACTESSAAITVAASQPGPQDGTPVRQKPAPAAPKALELGRPKANRRGRITLRLRTRSAGRLTVVATTRVTVRGKSRTVRYGARTVTVRSAGRPLLAVTPSRAAKGLRQRHARLPVTLKVTFTPRSGKKVVRTVRLTVNGPKR